MKRKINIRESSYNYEINNVIKNKIKSYSEPIILEIESHMSNLNNYISHEEFRDLCEILQDNKNIVALHIDNGNIGSDRTVALCQILQDNKNITSLRLSGNDIGYTGVVALAQLLKSNKNITSIDISNNNIGSEGIALLEDALRGNRSIETLHLSGNKIGDEGVQILAKSLIDTNITLLNLSKNNIGPKGIALLADVIRGNRIIETLCLSNNKIGDEGAKILAELLIDTNINRLSVDRNYESFVKKALSQNNSSKIIADDLMKYLTIEREKEDKIHDEEGQINTSSKQIIFKDIDIELPKISVEGGRPLAKARENILAFMKFINSLQNDIDVDSVAKFCQGKFAKEQISDFFNNLDSNLNEFFNAKYADDNIKFMQMLRVIKSSYKEFVDSALKNILSYSDNIKIAKICIDTGLDQFAEDILSDRDLISMKDGALHPSAYELMDKIGMLPRQWLFQRGQSDIISVLKNLVTLSGQSEFTDDEFGGFIKFFKGKLSSDKTIDQDYKDTALTEINKYSSLQEISSEQQTDETYRNLNLNDSYYAAQIIGESEGR